MSKKTPKRVKCTEEEMEKRLDPTLLIYLRTRKNLSKRDMEEKLGLAKYRWDRYETDSAKCDIRRVIVPRLREICNILEPDPFEVCDLIKYYPIDPNTLRAFRLACKKNGITPMEAILKFMKFFINECRPPSQRLK